VRRRGALTEPRARRGEFGSRDSDTVGRMAEGIARFLGSARFLVTQTLFVVAWIAVNVAAVSLRWDPYPFILLNLAFSTQAAYAAPLILLAQNRQEHRDRIQTENDREVAERTKNDTEYLARELAGVRLALADVVTNAELRDQLDDLTTLIERLSSKVDQLVAADLRTPAD
jgi:uncharacterized membrane protein